MRANDRTSPEFDQYAPSYAEMLEDPIRNRFTRDPLHFHRRKQAVIRRVLRRAGLDMAEQRWLDVGCGRGELLKLAGSGFAQALGCDHSAAMISTAGSFKIRHQPSSIELPFDSGFVDFVTAVCVFHHVHGNERELLADEIKRVLVPGGLCCILEHNPWNPLTRAIVRRCPVDVDAELLTARETAAMLLLAGFETIGTDYFLYLPEKLFNWAPSAENILRKLPFGGQYAVLARARY